MAVTAKWYGQALKNILSGNGVNWTGDTIKVMLCTSAYTPDQDTHQFKSSVTGEVAGTGYTAGGATLANKTITYDAANNKTILDADDVTWANSTITARYAVIYKDTGNAATSLLLGYIDFGADVASSNGNFTIQWDAGGIFTITAA
ncbi:hypothetical protein [Carboxydothermus hydrogenoformans]|uniref:hypothetical protein n=1 Tax=Carboxydothermus hydrogenoformans TaxID=129958 RepID=UPI0005A084B5|nr:hypothetical protein [Carboxydothermus hydrogenoformans]